MNIQNNRTGKNSGNIFGPTLLHETSSALAPLPGLAHPVLVLVLFNVSTAATLEDDSRGFLPPHARTAVPVVAQIGLAFRSQGPLVDANKN